MANLYISASENAIIYYMNKCKLNKSDLCRALNITYITLNKWIENPHNMKVSDIITMCGLFGISPECLLYLLIRNKPKLKKEHVKYVDNILFDVR